MDLMKYVPKGVTTKVARQVLLTQKHSPTILFGAGVVGVVATAVLAARATLKLEEVLEETQDNLAKAKNLHAQDRKDYTDKDYKQDVGIVYVRSFGSIAKLYGPSVVVGALTIASLTGSHHIMNKRNAGLMAAYAAVEKGFAEYRARVLNEYGADKEREFRYGSETREILEETKKGEPKVTRVKRVGKDGHSIYAKFFDSNSPSWDKKPEYNMLFLRAQQNYANHQLGSRGHLMLNEVYDALGIERTPEGFVVGWVKNGNGDGHVDFGVFDGQNSDRFHDFVTGWEDAILLDFNVDGVVYDKI